MSFDRSDPADLLALQTEVNTDPISMGYASASNTTQLLDLLNDSANNVGGETASRPFDAAALIDALDPQDFTLNQIPDADAAVYCNMLVQAQSMGVDISGQKAKFRALFALSPGSDTVTALDAQNTALSRAEVLFGQGTTLSRDDWFAARDYVA